ncbi:hypothetical protein LDC_1732 [sediment metagenome]|uniref:Uncharacterized protein n=1 Tax=sediment metagenome TaxID=749907 RepID=D9PJM2_9ZZZZ
MEKQRTKLEEFLNIIAARANVVNSLENMQNEKPIGNADYIAHKTNEINSIYLPMHSALDKKDSILSVNTRKDLLSIDKWLDFHPEAIYESGNLEEEAMVYLGNVLEQCEVKTGKKPHYLIITLSKDQRNRLSPYPEHLQTSEREVYTSGDVTWIDNKRSIVKNIFENDLPDSLVRLKDEDSVNSLIARGKENYERLARETTLYPNQWYESNDKTFSFQGYWPYSDKFNSKTESIDVFVRLVGNDKKYVGTFLTPHKLISLFDKWKKSGECANGTYVPLGFKNLLVKNLSKNSINKTISDLLAQESEFSSYFE